MNDFLSNEVFQWATKISLLLGLVWTYIQMKNTRDRHRDESVIWKREIELSNKYRDERYYEAIENLKKELVEHDDTNSRIYECIKRIQDSNSDVSYRLVRIETLLEKNGLKPHVPYKTD